MRDLLLLFVFFLLFASCGDDEEPLRPEQPDLETDSNVEINLPRDTGAIGFIVDGREVLAGGRSLKEIAVTFNDNRFARLSTRMPAIDRLGGRTFQWRQADFTAAELTRLREGTSVTIQLLDAAGIVVGEYENSAQIVDAAGRLVVPTSFSPRQPPSTLDFTRDDVVLLQARGSGKVLQVDAVRDEIAARMREYEGGKSIQRFRLVPTGAVSIYNLVGLIDEREVYVTAFSGPDGRTAISWERFGDTPPRSDNYRFALEARSDGFYYLRSVGTGRLLYDNGDRPSVAAIGQDPSQPRTQWRIVNPDLDWQVEDLGTTLSTPILPAADNEFAFKQRIRNCADATTETVIGVSRTRTQQATVTFEETVSLFSSRESSWDVRASLTVGGSFYGVNVSTTVESGYGQTTTNSLTETTTEIESETTMDAVQISSERTITVGPFASIVAYDVVQFYDNVRAHFVQRLRLRATTPDGRLLNAQELYTQLPAQYISGAITRFGDDFVEVTIRGQLELESWLDVATDVAEGEPCS